MAKFLNTSATNYYLEELIKNASERLILISPFLKLNDRIRELLEDKDRLKIDIRIVYGKSELQPDEINWLKGLSFVRTSFCKNLHAKCYMNSSKRSCLITKFSQSSQMLSSLPLFMRIRQLHSGRIDFSLPDGLLSQTIVLFRMRTKVKSGRLWDPR